MQQFMFLKDDTECVVQLPPTDTELLPGVRWATPVRSLLRRTGTRNT